MPKYSFLCDTNDGGCDHRFDKSLTFTQYDEFKTKHTVVCPSCKKRKYIRIPPNIPTVIDITPTTVGALTERNSSRISADEKHHIAQKHTDYRRNKGREAQPLPDGMTRGRDMVD